MRLRLTAKPMVCRVLPVIAILCSASGADKPAEKTPLSIPGSEPFVFRQVDGVELRLHVVKPTGWMPADRRPCLVAFFGGGWNSGTPERGMRWAKWAAQQGLVGIAPDYRTRNRFGAVPEDCVADGRAAFRWVIDHAAKLGIDPEKIIVQGTSSGGHVATWTAIPSSGPGGNDPAPPLQPVALILINPVTDTKDGGYGGTKKFGTAERALACSALDQMPDTMPPAIVFHATADQSVPYANSVSFRDRMTANGNQCELVTFDGFGHSYYARSKFGEKGVAADRKTFMDAHAFLAALGLVDR